MPTPIERAETEKNLAAAKECFLDGTIATIAQAAREHGVKEGTLRNRLKGMRPRSERPVNNKRLNDAQELAYVFISTRWKI
jgi:transposase-like protein